jgi:hypothetical protein
MWPFSLFAPGNLNQPILPGWSFGNVSVNYAGNADIEKDVVEKVASYGKQLGIITDAVLELAGNPPPEGEDPIARLKDIADRIEKLKRENEASLAEQARAAMDKLAKQSPASAHYIASKYSGPSSP